MKKFLKTLIPADIAKGLQVTGRHLFEVLLTANHRKNPLHLVNEYPEEPAHVSPRYRGRLQMLLDEAGDPKCVCCMACVKACPTGAITLEAGKKEGRKTRLPVRYDFEMERCAFCGFCVEACGFDAIALNHEFELAAYDREEFSLGLHGLRQNISIPLPVARFSVIPEGQDPRAKS